MPTIQFVERPGIVDLGWGHPDPTYLPLDTWGVATETALRKHGWKALTYGFASGPDPLVDWLTDRLERIDGRRPGRDELFVTSGASQALELVSTTLTRPGSVVLVDAPTYHIALQIFADHAVEVRAAPGDAHGIDPGGTAELIRQLDRRVSILYLVPTFANPTGASLPMSRRQALVDVVTRAQVTIVEDDTYRELSYVDATPPSLWSMADGGVVRIGSFSKTVAPGLRLGWLTAPPELVERLANRGFVNSGGGVNHTTAMAMAEFGASGEYDRHLAAVRMVYGHRRDVLASAVRREVRAEFSVPEGGWFLWLRLPVAADALLAAAERRGVSFLPGAHFFTDPAAGAYHARLAFSMLDDARLEHGARLFGEALNEISTQHEISTQRDERASGRLETSGP